MRQRESTKTETAQTDSGYPHEGIALIQVCGYVQEVKRNEKLKCDYVRFNITSKINPEFYDIISVCVPDSVGVCCDVGDCVLIRGFVRSWQRNGITLELVAERVAEIDPAQLKGVRK